MKNIGIIRNVDREGRLVIPKEMRDSFGLNKEVEIIPTTEGVLIRNPKYKMVEIEKEQ